MIFGLLFFDSSKEMTNLKMIEVARTAFERRQDLKATIALIPMSMDESPEIDGLMVSQSYLVRPHHVIVGVPMQDKLPHHPFKLANPDAQ